MTRRRKARGPSSQGAGDGTTAHPGQSGVGTRGNEAPTAPRRPYAGPGGSGQYGHRQEDRRRHSLQTEDTSPSRYSRGQQRGGPPRSRRPRPPREEHARQSPSRPAPPRGASTATIDPFDLFCAYHLGITDTDTYRIQNIHEVARRFGTNAGALKQTLGAYGMEADDIIHSGFDLAGAQVDIMVAPEGISRRELARPLYNEFKSAPRRSRDWSRELAEAERHIERTIGAEGRWSPGPRDAGGKQ